MVLATLLPVLPAVQHAQVVRGRPLEDVALLCQGHSQCEQRRTSATANLLLQAAAADDLAMEQCNCNIPLENYESASKLACPLSLKFTRCLL